MTIGKISRSVVAVRATVPDDAFTANALGTRREGSGVVIRDNGLVLTIGYQINEAEEVWMTVQDGGEVADINMIVPIDLLTTILDDLIKRGHAAKSPRPWLVAFSSESNVMVVVM